MSHGLSEDAPHAAPAAVVAPNTAFARIWLSGRDSFLAAPVCAACNATQYKYHQKPKRNKKDVGGAQVRLGYDSLSWCGA